MPPLNGPPLSNDEFQGRVRLAALGAVGLLAAGAYAAAAVAGTGAGGGVLLAMPALYAVGLSGAAVLAYLLYARARVGDDDRLRWMGAGYALAGVAALLQALTLSELAVSDPFDGSGSGAAALYLVWHTVVPTCALLAVVGEHWRRVRGAFVVGALCLLVLLAWDPAAAELQNLVGVDGAFAPLYRRAVAALAIYAAVAAAVWTVGAGRKPTWLEAWISVSLALVAFDLLLWSGALGFFGPAWWASAVLRTASFALPAAGLLMEFVRLFDVLRHHEQGLTERVAREVDIALRAQQMRSATAIDPEAVERIQEVLVSEAFTMVFQPVFDLATDAQAGAEALARFDGPPQRTPDVWFAEAAMVGCGKDLELAAIRRALASADGLSPDLYLAVNVSPETVLDPRLGELCAAMPELELVLEVTEHAQVDDYLALGTALGLLRQQGAKLAVDDAGAGFASFRHIIRLEPDVIKLDISLVRDIDLHPMRRSLAASLVAFADQIGSVIVAEGIETDAELDVLRQLGVHFGQGYRLAHPSHLAVSTFGRV